MNFEYIREKILSAEVLKWLPDSPKAVIPVPGETRIIRKFLREYKRNGREAHERLAEKAKATCAEALQSAAIQAQVTCRTKDPESLRNKINRRNFKINGGYKSTKEIKRDIVDLAGVRISLYFPNHRTTVENIIQNHFEVHERIEHGTEIPEGEESHKGLYVSRFSGYRAMHFRVSLLYDDKSDEETDLSDTDPDDEQDMIEIQIISMLNHTWAEVGHDLVYKQMKGMPSSEEHRILDGLNGLIQVGEVLLEQLHDVYLERSKQQDTHFSNHYELGSFLSTCSIPSEIGMGSLEVLLKFLKTVGYDKRQLLMEVVTDLEKSGWRVEGLVHEFQSMSLKPNLSLVIIVAILQLPHVNRKEFWREVVMDRGDPDKHKCKVMATTIVLLNELFPPFNTWTKKLFLDNDDGGDARWKRSIWLDSIRNLDEVIDGRQTPSKRERGFLNEPWSWFESQPHPIIGFAFNVARMGVFANYAQFARLKSQLIIELLLEEDYQATTRSSSPDIRRPRSLPASKMRVRHGRDMRKTWWDGQL